MSFRDVSTPSPDATASSSSINTTIVASSSPQLVASTLASTAPSLSQHLAASSVMSSPIFPPRVAAPSLVPAAAFPMVLPTVPSLGSTGFINHQRFPPQQAFGPSVAPNVSPISTVPSVPHLLPFTQTQLPQLATVPAGQGNPTFPGTPSLFFNQYPVPGPGVSIPGVHFPGHGFVASGSPSYPPAAFPSFVVGPGIPPVPPKLVAAIVSGDFIDFVLLLEDHVDPDAPSFFLVADQLVIRPTKRRKEITDILTWMQAFSVYMLVLTTYWPARITDLLKYQLLIMRTAQQFSGSTWLSYDRAFRRQAAAYNQTDWSFMNTELYYFHVSAAAAVTKSPSASTVSNPSSLSSSPQVEPRNVVGMEAHGTPSAQTVCHSWNAGRCSSQFSRCRFRHMCDFPGCSALHRRSLAHRKPRSSTFRDPQVKRSRFSDV